MHNVASLSHSRDVKNVGLLVSYREQRARLEENHVTSVLECSADLCGVQGKLKFGLTVGCVRLRIVCEPKIKRKDM